MSRKVKSVSFNTEDPFEKEMYEYSKKFSNFSSFVKRLIHISMNGKQPVANIEVGEISELSTDKPKINKDFLRQLI
ncbi:hypothetical protein [Heyndrickxia camelliae]|uniref:Uncharacterized protein n=1 Tax=Heyndrickxia camelliae TaxID=1707093 RepID=A0A2N3LE37_9BACI|nr:hypothetical protein [Heyndrickxia camelliae]PKR82871.1 hypothetical protein CWO92_22030 [Heyndrickxia camelliae]